MVGEEEGGTEMKTKVSLSHNGLNLHPTNINSSMWYYEEPDGLRIYDRGILMCTISWRKVAASLKRKEAAKRKAAPK